jgi:protoporphyrinogen oxidase
VTLAQQGVEVTVLEATEAIGGGTYTSEKDPSRLDFLEARRGTDIFAATAPDLGRVQRVSGLVSEHDFIVDQSRKRARASAAT